MKKQIAEKGGIWCSRDAVRFSMVHTPEEYFSREDEVFNEWIKQIYDALTQPFIEDIYIDATHLTDKARDKVLNRLPKEYIGEIINVFFKVPLEVCLERNSHRDGMTFVPPSAIKNMYKILTYPKKYKTIVIDENGVEIDG